MQKKTVSGLLSTLLLLSMLSLAFNIQPVRASGTIYIRPDGTVEGTDKVQRDGDVYTFIDNIYDEIVVQRDNIVLDGGGYTLQGTGAYPTIGISLSGRSKVTIKNTEIKTFYYGVWLEYSYSNSIVGNNIRDNGFSTFFHESSNNAISGNNITNNWEGILLYYSSICNTISRNNITNNDSGITIHRSSNNTIVRNNITNNKGTGVHCSACSNNSITRNNIANHRWGISFHDSSNNIICHNSFLDNTQQVFFYDYLWTYPTYPPSISIWDDGYPSGGNYWSDHVTIDDCSGVNQDEPGSDGIVDEPYVIDDYNRDHYPLVEPWSPAISATTDIAPDTLHLMSTGKWVTCYVELPEGYNVSDIDVSTVMLNDIIPVSLLDVPAQEPVPTEIGDYDNDGIQDLMVKFDRAMVSEFIPFQRIVNGVVTLTITGELYDGTLFEGTDTIRVLMGGGGTGRRK